MKTILNTLACLLLATFCAHGQCAMIVTTAVDENGNNYFSFRRPIELKDGNGQATINAYALTDNKSIAVLFAAHDSEMCFEKGDAITFNFVDGKKLDLQNDMESNCAEKFAIFFGAQFGNEALLNTLTTKSIANVTLNHKGKKVSGSFPRDKAEAFTRALQCLHEALTSETVAKELIEAAANPVYTVVEQMPEFVGGYDPMMEFIRRNLKTLNVNGAVYVSFIVDKEGNVTEPKVIKSLSRKADAEALRVISQMPPWSPGRQQGKPVKVRLVLPIKFG
jgi:TonB family protein